MKKFILLFILSFPLFASAQVFDRALGIRGGVTSGFEYRIYTDDANSYKFLLGTNNGLRIHGFKEFHRYDLFTFTDQLIFFYGAGIHGGYENWDEYYVKDNISWHENHTAFVMGLDGLVGLEYMFYEVPLSIGLEAKPFLDIFGQHMFHFEPFDIAFTLKYLF